MTVYVSSSNPRQPTPGRLIRLGRLSATQAVVDAFEPSTIAQVLKRHAVGDWGDIDDDDWQMNEAVMDDSDHDGRLFSVYKDVPSKHGALVERVWIITDAPETDDTITTVLLPDDY